MRLAFVQKINLKEAIDRYENEEDTNSGYDYGESDADDETITKRN
ncbi:11206_t:CDS:2 [Entrophospora sp. SA101]|nr:5505_t:CDS:2 [Entrophospora sp. SA101]CAJ0905366.1 11206_t:CDS:2 [Entrophospora sp. SA101]